MSIKYNNKIIAGKYKEQIIPFANTTEAGIAKIATQEEINEGVDNTSIVTPVYLSKKQNKLTAGEGINIDATNTISSKILPDKVTIIENDDKTISTVARKTVNKNIIFDWEGTQVEYQQALRNGEIKPDWYCYITDDEEIVDFTNIPNTNLSNLTQDGINTINNIVDERTDIKLNNKLDLNLGNLDNEGSAILNNKANIDLTNLSTQGQNILNYKLNKSQITNCILEIPQRIEIILNDEYLALKEGSDIVIPYGTEDLTTQFPVGSKFLIDSCTVVDTSYVGGKFFVIAKYGSQYNIPVASSGTTTTKMFFVVGVRPEGNAWSHRTSAKDLAISGTTAPTGNGFFYNTTENTLRYYNQGTMDTVYYGFPVALVSVVQGVYEAIDQTFNGMGYIGSTWFVDKGVKYIVANGRNTDETLKNIETETDGILIASDSVGSSTPQKRIGFLGININNGKPSLSFRLAQNCFEQSIMPTSLNQHTGFAGYWYNPETNKQYVCSATTGTPNWLDSYIGVPIIDYDLKTGSSLLNVGDFRKPFRAVDYNDLKLGNSIKTVVETYVNGTSWYRVWSDGFCEQGGVSTGSGELTVTLLKPYKDTNYSVLMTYVNATSTSQVYINNNSAWDKTVNSFKQRGAGSSISKQWEAKGYI